MAFNYGGRADIVEAARRLAAEAVAGRLDPSAIDEPLFGGCWRPPACPSRTS